MDGFRLTHSLADKVLDSCGRFQGGEREALLLFPQAKHNFVMFGPLQNKLACITDVWATQEIKIVLAKKKSK